MSEDQDKSVDYQAGFTAGYQARTREETESYLAAVMAGRSIYDRVIRDLVELKPFSERESDRLAIIKEGHDAGIHEGGRQGCPWCDGVRAVTQADRILGLIKGPAACVPHGLTEPHECRYYYPASIRHHSGHYGVCSKHGQTCITCPDPRRCPQEHRDPDYVVGHPIYGVSRVTDDGHLVGSETGLCFGSCPADGGHRREVARSQATGHAWIAGTNLCSCGNPACVTAPDPVDPCAGGCSDPAAHAEGGHDV